MTQGQGGLGTSATVVSRVVSQQETVNDLLVERQRLINCLLELALIFGISVGALASDGLAALVLRQIFG